ncbi:MAG: hypothetical protein JW900_07405 [Anaerolineae bacterium]|nr:hypothetical protein [Anaerolineae bacterium]
MITPYRLAVVQDPDPARQVTMEELRASLVQVLLPWARARGWAERLGCGRESEAGVESSGERNSLPDWAPASGA